MMPALQKIYVSATQFRFAGPSVEALFADFSTLPSEPAVFAPPISKTFENNFALRNAAYRYPGTDRSVLNNFNLEIPARSVVGIVGPSGSGKTTVVDLMLGIIAPQIGSLEVDGSKLSKPEIKAWQRNIGYVPQQIYLTDNSIRANIAFGVADCDIDQQAVERAAMLAKLHDFVEAELPQKYETRVGERGIRLSGGQRQRIGIARALYHRPQVIVFDEATSALDNLIERAIMEDAYMLGKDVTVVLVTHRLDTVKNCDSIFVMDKGQVRARGTFAELLESDDLFKDLVGSQR